MVVKTMPENLRIFRTKALISDTLRLLLLAANRYVWRLQHFLLQDCLLDHALDARSFHIVGEIFRRSAPVLGSFGKGFTSSTIISVEARCRHPRR
jgi:hypothetical protein